MKSKTSMLEVLRRVIQEVNGARNLDAALSTMVRRIRKAMQTDVCSFYLYDKELESLVLMETIGLRTQAVGRVVLPLGEGLVGLVAKRSEPLNLEDAQTHPQFRYFEAYWLFSKPKSAAMMMRTKPSWSPWRRSWRGCWRML